MHRQVGCLETDARGVATRGLIIRHLVMPNNIAGTDRFTKWVASELGKDTYVNLMAQYRPEHKAFDYPKIDRRLTRDEWKQAVAWAEEGDPRRGGPTGPLPAGALKLPVPASRALRLPPRPRFPAAA